jgi:hypothetical protein
MKTLALGALLAGFLAACGGGGSDDVQTQIDARVVDAAPGIDATEIDAMPPLLCTPWAPAGQQGCAANEKCTWVRVQTTPSVIGKLACVPDGPALAGEACSRGADGETTGYDNCVAGNICVGISATTMMGTCQDVCGFDGTATASCGSADFACTRYRNLFANGMDTAYAGACNPTCDPVEQTLNSNGQPCAAGQGCYTLTSMTDTVAVCVGAGTLAHGAPIPGQASANSCLPFHSPRRTAPGAATSECGAYCVPNAAGVTEGVNEGDEGGVAAHTCESLGASPPESAGSGESCRFFWAREGFTTLSPFSNTLGFCWAHTKNWYDSNADMTGDMPTPRCVNLVAGADTLPPISTAPNIVPDALYFWCTPYPTMLQKAISHSKQYLAEQVGNPIDVEGGW